MEWYLRENSDGLIVPKACEDVNMEDLLSEQDDWRQWGYAESEDKASPNNYDDSSFHRQSMYRQVGDEVPSGSGAQGETVFEFENGSQKMDDMFLDSCLQEDQLCPDAAYTSMSCEDLMSNMLADTTNPMDTSRRRSKNCMSFQSTVDDFSSNWNKEEISPSCLTSEYPMDDNFMVPVPPVTNNDDNGAEVDDLDENECSEAMVLLELERVTLQMNANMRICFRDAMYRLAISSKQKHAMPATETASEIPFSTQDNSLHFSMAETSTNMIDRTIANLMFNEQHCGLPMP